MKKILVTLCSLALSIAGTFGANQLASKDEVIIDNNKKQVIREQDADMVDDAFDLPEDEIETEVTDLVDNEKSELEVESPNGDKAKKNKTNDRTEDKETVDKRINNIAEKKANKKAENKSDNKSEVIPVANLNNVAKQDTNSNKNNNTNTNSSKININDFINDFKSSGKNVYVYKNIDLSNCNSVQNVVDELQKNGYKNINMNNIQDISSLEDILSMIGDRKPQTNTDKPAPSTPKQPTPSTPKQPAPTTAPTNPSNNSYADEVLRLVNIEREKAGLSHLTINATLKAAADKRAQETKVSFSHTRPNGSKFSTVLQEYGISYRTAGENIAYGQRSPQEVVTGWMNSPGHRANILNGSFNKIGIGVYQSKGVIYWSQLFTN